MTQHTPGPWTLQHLETEHHGYPGWNVFLIRSPQNVALAEVGHIDNFESERIRANARLIAKAPEILETLRDVTATLENVLLHFRKGMSPGDKMGRDKVVDGARALLKEIET